MLRFDRNDENKTMKGEPANGTLPISRPTRARESRHAQAHTNLPQLLVNSPDMARASAARAR